MRKYLFIFVLCQLCLVSCSNDTCPPVFVFPSFEEAPTISVSYHSVTIIDTMTMHNSDVVVRLYYSTDSTIGTSDCSSNVIALNPITYTIGDKFIVNTTINGLTDNTVYYYTYGFVSPYNERYKDGCASTYSETRSFVTLKNDAPIVITYSAECIGFFGAELIAEKISDNSDSPTTEWGVCFSTHSGTTIDDSKLSCPSSVDEKVGFRFDRLSSGTTYYFKAYGINPYGISYGEEKSFKTISTSIMKVETQMPTSKGSNFALLSGKITAEDSVQIIERGFYISSFNSIPDEKDEIVKSSDSGGGEYQCNVTGLTAFTTYYVRAYAICQYGELYGNVIVFTTEH